MDSTSANSPDKVVNLHSLQQALAMEPLEDVVEFHEMIRERKEKIKAKIEKKRREIVNRLQWNGNEIASNLKLFGLPDEMLIEIVSHVTPQDLASLSEAHPKFSHLSHDKDLESKYRESLLSQILSIEKLPYLCDLGRDLKRIYPLKMFRSFSKAMRASVDRIIEENFMKDLQESESQKGCYFNIHLTWMESLNGLFTNFCEGPIETRAKRVFPRSLRLCLISMHPIRYEGFLEFTDKVTSLLEVIGEDIWYFEFIHDDLQAQHLSEIGVTVNQAYCLLQQWVSLMPNLKWLNVDFRYGLSTRRKDTISEESFNQHPFPHLPHLERIKFGVFKNNHLRSTFVSAVLRPNLHIKSLLLIGLVMNRDADRLFLMEMEPLLSMLDLNWFAGSAFGTSAMEVLKPIFSKNWKLKSFSQTFVGLDVVDLTVLFSLLNNIPTLEHLNLDPQRISIGNNIPLLKLPNLTHFKLELDSFEPVIWSKMKTDMLDNVNDVIFFTSLRFLVECVKLKSICWEFTGYWSNDDNALEHLKAFVNRHEQREMIKFKCGLEMDLIDSNLWNVFPELEFVKTSVRIPLPGANCKWNVREIRKFKLA